MKIQVEIDGKPQTIEVPDDSTPQEIDEIVNSSPAPEAPGVGSKILYGLKKAGDAMDKAVAAPARAGIRYGMSKLADATQGTDLTKGRTYDELSKPFVGEEMEGTFGKTGGKIVAEAGNMAADVSNVIPFNAVGKMVKGGAKAVSGTAKAYKGVTKATTGLGDEVFEAASTRAGRKAIESAAGKQYTIGKKIENFLKKPWDFIPEKKVVDEAIPKMGAIEIENTVKALESSKVADAFTKEAKAANKAIDEMVQDLGGHKPLASYEMGLQPKKLEPKTLDASKAINVRRQLDREINWDDPTDALVGKAYLNARMALMGDLINAAKKTGNDQYIEAMQGMKKKLELVEALQKKVGKSSEAFVSNLFNGSKTEAQELVKELSKITGEDFIKDAKNVSFAKQLGKDSGGKVPILPVHTTGKALLGTGLAGVGGTVAATVGLPAAAATAPIAALTMSPALAVRTYGTGKALARAISKSAKNADRAAKVGYGIGKPSAVLNRLMSKRKEEEDK